MLGAGRPPALQWKGHVWCVALKGEGAISEKRVVGGNQIRIDWPFRHSPLGQEKLASTEGHCLS